MPQDQPEQSTTGADLAAARRTAGFTAREVAAAAGISRTRVVVVEGAACVRQQTAAKILQAIADLIADREAQR